MAATPEFERPGAGPNDLDQNDIRAWLNSQRDGAASSSRQAQDCYQQVLTTATKLGNHRTVANILTRLAAILRETGRHRAATSHLRRALSRAAHGSSAAPEPLKAQQARPRTARVAGTALPDREGCRGRAG